MKPDKNPTNITIFDVARAANTSHATVSRVLNNRSGVSPKTRARVLEAIETLGYVANPQARRLAGAQTNMVGLLIHKLDQGYANEVSLGIDEELGKAGYDLVIYSTHRYGTKETKFVTSLTKGQVDGLLIMRPLNLDAYINVLREQDFPHVLIDDEGINADCPSISPTNWQGAYDATKYLLSLGHRRIGFIAGQGDSGCAIDRLDGYCAALADHGISRQDELILEGDFERPGGYATAQQLLDLPIPPTAIFASNDYSAFGAMDAVFERGLQVPEDISIVGFDDIQQSSWIRPALTTVRQPMRQMGRTAARLLLRLIEDTDHVGRSIQLATRLIVRESCQPPCDDGG